MRQMRKSKNTEVGWFLILLLVGVLFICLLLLPQLRHQQGGKWSLPLIGVAFVIVLYLQPSVAHRVHRWRSDRRDEAEKRWWRERDKREQAAQLRIEALRHEKVQRESRRRRR
ncbi:hypothetical protein [Armatimonas sp.]|uniref:hypothetical protein n=1 Tax=Armatimonas sp. TaxID=1872638 RepID=UPI00375026CD